jgi:hypothetical protein
MLVFAEVSLVFSVSHQTLSPNKLKNKVEDCLKTVDDSKFLD